MADPGRLDELQRKFDENPRRYFAPLASELRKEGDPERAIALCRAYLAQQPGHMSGYVVYGQALFDAGHRHEASEAFEQAIALDPENMIAMRYLGDIAREEGDLELASGWYRKLLDLDPRDETVSAYLTELTSQLASTAAQAVSTAPDLPEEPQPPVEGTVAVEMPPLEEIRLEEGLPAEEVFPPEEVLPLDSLRSPAEVLAVTPPEMAPPVEEASPLGIEEVSPLEVEEASPVEEASSPEEEHVLSEPILPEAATAWVEMAAAPVDVSEFPFITEFAATEATEAVTEATGLAAAAVVPAPPTDEPEEEASQAGGELRAPFVTETMATLYLQQGFTAKALEVYRQLVVLRPEPRLQDRILELEQTLAAEAVSVRDFFARIGARRPATVAVPPPPSPSGVAALFPGAPADARDVRAAAALAGAYAAPQ